MNHRILPAFALALSSIAVADGTESLGLTASGIAGLGRATYAGVGLATQPNTFTVDLPQDARIKQVLAYWDGLDAPADTQGDLDHITVNGLAVTGKRVGGSTNFYKDYWVSSYRADLTDLGLVGPGQSTLTASGLDWSYANNGLALVIITEDNRTFELYDGLDYAADGFGAPYDRTKPVTYHFEPANEAREATIGLLVGGVADQRPSAIEIRVDGVLTIEALDVLSSNMGSQLDAHTFDFTVPAGAEEVSVQLFSEDRGGQFTGNQPASMTWLHSGFSMEAEESQGERPLYWRLNAFRWDGRYVTDNDTFTVRTDTGFNETFHVHPWFSGVSNRSKLWHTLRGKGSYDFPARRKLNMEVSAALINADSGTLNYPLTTEEVIELYRDAVGADNGPETVFSAYWILFEANRLGS